MYSVMVTRDLTFQIDLKAFGLRSHEAFIISRLQCIIFNKLNAYPNALESSNKCVRVSDVIYRIAENKQKPIQSVHI